MDRPVNEIESTSKSPLHLSELTQEKRINSNQPNFSLFANPLSFR